MTRLGRWMLVGATSLAIGGCNRTAEPPVEPVANEAPAIDVPLPAPEPVPEPEAPPPPENKIEGAGPDRPLSEDEQMMEDAEASGMTAREAAEEASGNEGRPAEQRE